MDLTVSRCCVQVDDPDRALVQEPADQPWGVRDGAVRDPAGNLVRIQQVG